MRKLILFLSVLLCTSSIVAQVSIEEPNTILLSQKDGSRTSTSLYNHVVMSFLNDNLHFYVQSKPTIVSLDDVEEITFMWVEANHPADTEDTAIELPWGEDERTSNTRKIIENGMLIIIKDGIRYNIYGMRL